MQNYFCDMHIHIGRAKDGKIIKIPSSKNLTFENIIREAAVRKGMDLIGIVDCASPSVIKDIETLIQNGDLVENSGGGYLYQNKMGVILASEVGTTEKQKKCTHQLCYFPDLNSVKQFSDTMKNVITNIGLSSQKSRIPATDLFEIVHQFDGLMIPAHAFTPYNGMYGSCVSSFQEMFSDKQIELIPAIELGLSADTFIADHIKELGEKSFLSNSDSHSLGKIAREYNEIKMESLSFSEWKKALQRKEGRRIVRNFGLDPRLGKYHRNFCKKCENILSDHFSSQCEKCGSDKIVSGVLDRVEHISQRKTAFTPRHRAEYVYQIPLKFIPGLGNKSYEKLLNVFHTEMKILNFTSLQELREVVKGEVAEKIALGSAGKLNIQEGGGGHYGKII